MRAVQALCHLFFPALCYKYSQQAHFTDKGTEAQQMNLLKVTQQGSGSWD